MLNNHGKKWEQQDINSIHNIIKNKTNITEALCTNVFGRTEYAVRQRILKTLYEIRKNGGSVSYGIFILEMTMEEFEKNYENNNSAIINKQKYYENYGKFWADEDTETLIKLMNEKKEFNDEISNNIFGRPTKSIIDKIRRIIIAYLKDGKDINEYLHYMNMDLNDFQNKYVNKQKSEKKQTNNTNKFEYIKNQFEMLNEKIDILTELLKKNELNK